MKCAALAGMLLGGAIGTALAAAPAAAANLFATPGGSPFAICTQDDPCGLQAALLTAQALDTVFLAGGSYTGALDPVATIGVSLTLRGGWNGDTTTPPVVDPLTNVTVLDGEGVRRVLAIAGGGPGFAVTLENLEIRNGHSSGGSGVNAVDAALTIRGCAVASCDTVPESTEAVYGGGVSVLGGSLLVEDSFFSQNSVHVGCCLYGGAIAARNASPVVIRDTGVSENDAWFGPGVYVDAEGGALTVERTWFAGNGRGRSVDPLIGGGGYGGGLHASRSSLALLDAEFFDNAAINFGGGAYFSGPSAVIERCSFEENSGGGGGGGLSVSTTDGLRLVNSFFRANATAAGSRASGVEIRTGGADILHATILGTGGSNNGAGIVAFANAQPISVGDTILAALTTGLSTTSSSLLYADGILWGGGSWANGADVFDGSGAAVVLGPTSVTGDPGFLDTPPERVPWITATSIARNAGVPADVATDIEGFARAGAPDIGASEYLPRVAMGNPPRRSVLRAGSLRPLHYGGPEGTAEFNLAYSTNGGATWRSVVEHVTRDAFFSWEVPPPPGNRRSVLLKATGFDGTGKIVGRGRSRGPFEIRVVQVDAPAAGDAWTGGTGQTLAWTTYRTIRPVASVRLFFSTDGGRRWRRITPAVPAWNPGRHAWTLPVYARAKGNCRVKVVLRDAAGKVVGTARSGRFTIARP